MFKIICNYPSNRSPRLTPPHSLNSFIIVYRWLFLEYFCELVIFIWVEAKNHTFTLRHPPFVLSKQHVFEFFFRLVHYRMKRYQNISCSKWIAAFDVNHIVIETLRIHIMSLTINSTSFQTKLLGFRTVVGTELLAINQLDC